jgi:hypothetical protein
MPRQPTVINVRIENTPSPADPEGASKFYQALGMAVMASARLEGQFSMCLIAMMGLPGAGDKLGYILPVSWRKRAEMWRTAFNAVPVLQLTKPFFEPLIVEIMDAVQDRHRLVHALWENFVSDAPLTVATLHVKHKRGTTNELDINRVPITIDMLHRITATADSLNRRLLPVCRFVSSLRRPPPDARRL